MTGALAGLRITPISFFAVVALGTSAPITVWAHGGEDPTEVIALAAWYLTPEMVIVTALLVIIYGRGMLRRRDAAGRKSRWRHAMFFFGIAAVFLSLQSSIDPIAERLFWMHQVQHLLAELT